MIHAVFSTKQRPPCLSGELKAQLFPSRAASISRLKGKPVIVNGPRDHVHILFSLPPVLSLSDAMEKLKANSSKWVHNRWAPQRFFAWQTGYAACRGLLRVKLALMGQRPRFTLIRTVLDAERVTEGPRHRLVRPFQSRNET